ncbi:MAG TPA: M28 family peptidase [Mycobacteriales bacterium]|nr:M28 family peptidase [Mycobacteriales bacterium]
MTGELAADFRATFARLAAIGRNPAELAARGLALASHLDRVRSGGAYDGALGVVAGFLAMRSLQRHRPAHGRPVCVLAFVEEEGARFGLAGLLRLPAPELATAAVHHTGVLAELAAGWADGR